MVVGGGGPRSVLPTEKKVDRTLNHLHNPENKVSAEKSPNIELMVQLSRTPDSKWAQARTHEFYRWRIMNPARRYIALWWKDPRPLGVVLLAVAAEGDQSRIVASGAEDASISRQANCRRSAFNRRSLGACPVGAPDQTGTTDPSDGILAGSTDGNIRVARVSNGAGSGPWQ